MVTLSVVFWSCVPNEPICMIESFSGKTYEAVEITNEAGEEVITYYVYSADFTEREIAPEICDEQAFASVMPAFYQIKLDSAHVNNNC